jgi:hypothetical protein
MLYYYSGIHTTLTFFLLFSLASGILLNKTVIKVVNFIFKSIYTLKSKGENHNIFRVIT